MNLHENINRIKQVMGVLNEQTNGVIIVEGEFTATGKITRVCDELHAFESICKVDPKTKQCIPNTSQMVGGMHTKVGAKLNELYKNGINPKVTNVEVTVDDTKVSWKCTIEPSTDGKAWVGFTSRGAGCSDVTDRAVSDSEGKSPSKIKANIDRVLGEEDRDFEKIGDFTHVGEGAKTFRQVFYIYTRPTKYPPHASGQKSKPVTPDPIKTTSAAATITPAIQSPRDGTNATVINPIIQSKKDTASVNTTVKPTKDTAVVKQNTSTDKKTTVAAETAEVENIKRPAGDPYVYGKNKNGEYLAYRCGKNQACPSPNQIPWINITQGKKNNKPKYADYESAIKTLIYNE